MQSPIIDLKGQTILITGAGQGVGRSVALKAAVNGAGSVIVNDFVMERAEAVAEEVRATGCSAMAVQADVSDHHSVREMFEQVRTMANGVDVLVNNAGNSGTSDVYALRAVPFWEQDASHWQPFLGVNLFGVLHTCREAIPYMRDRGAGRIVNVISDAGRVGDVTLEVYSGAKAGVAGFTRAIARAVGRFGITANCVSLAVMKTPTLEKKLSDPEVYKKMMASYILRRPGEPDDAANMILMLGSDASSWVTGQTYPVNGGFSLAL